MTLSFKKTEKQIEAIREMGGEAKHTMLFGGSRSGKTFIAIYGLIVRASRVPNSRHCVLRLKYNHAMRSIWMDTLPKVLKICFPELQYKENKTYSYIELSNGSQIWVGGLDDKERSEKILGNEYSTIYFNECSQFTEKPIAVALTRLAQLNDLKKRAWYDCNPGSKKHWSHWKFIKKRNKDGSPFNPDNYNSILMNPRDNLENIDPEYISDILGSLAPQDRARFEHGEFDDGDNNLIYYSFNRDLHVKEFELETGIPYWTGFDFNHSPMTAVFGWIRGNTLYVYDEIYQLSTKIKKGMTATESAAIEIQSRYGKKGAGKIKAIPDSTGKKSTSNANRSDIKILKMCGFEVSALRNPFRVDRYSAANASFNQMRVVIHPRCKYTIRDLEEQSFKEGTDQPDTTDKDIGHIADALTYLIYRTVNPIKGGSVKIHIQER